MTKSHSTIVLDDWKLSIFREELDAQGFEYEDAGPWQGEHTILKVTYENTNELIALGNCVEKAAARCEKERKNYGR